jgi:mono/diheme cytochrome c family protein
MEQDGNIDLSEIADAVHTLSKIGPVIDLPDRLPAATPESVANGRRLYLTACAGCHGPEGRGDGPLVAQMKESDGTPVRPRDLAAGSFKGGGDDADLYARIVIGMPGTAMPANTQLKPDEVGDIINYVRSLASRRSPAGADTAAPTAGRTEPGAGGSR